MKLIWDLRAGMFPPRDKDQDMAALGKGHSLRV